MTVQSPVKILSDVFANKTPYYNNTVQIQLTQYSYAFKCVIAFDVILQEKFFALQLVHFKIKTFYEEGLDIIPHTFI